ncbi:MAG TPA: site-2 protease family protein [Kofleriaceae bacterium]
MDISAAQLKWIFIDVFVLIISISLHEFGHAFMATRLGDDTPARQGRVTLNPIAHIDPVGTLLLPILGGLFAAAGAPVGGFGWGKPVQWQPHRIRRGINMSTAKILVAIAGPLMNALLACVVALTHGILMHFKVLSSGSDLNLVLYFAVATNFILMFFNLLPLPPLDGGHVAEQFVPYKHRDKFHEVAKYAPFVILGIMLIPKVQQVFLIPAIWCTEHVYRAVLALFS